MRVPDIVENSKLNRRRGQLLKLIPMTLVEKIGASAERSSFAERRQGADFDDLRAFLGRGGGEPPCVGDKILVS
jgi:hypothetical protein